MITSQNAKNGKMSGETSQSAAQIAKQIGKLALMNVKPSFILRHQVKLNNISFNISQAILF